MAPLRFSVPHAEEFDPRVWETAYITGIEGIPWQCEHTLSGDQFSIGREIDESGKLHIVWPTRSVGNICLSSTSLPIQDQSYSLAIEIARGTVHRLRTQAAEWQRVGMRLPDEFFPLAALSLDEFLRSLTIGGGPAARNCHAQRAIDLALQASLVLCRAFSTQALEARRNNEGRLATLLGCQLTSDCDLDQFGQGIQSAFNLVCISADLGKVEAKTGGNRDYFAFDQQVEWAATHGRRICLGPMVDFRDGRMPEWLFLLNEGFESVLHLACDHVQKTVERYRGRVQLWNCGAGINVPNQFGWSDEEILRMSVSLIETVRRNDDRSPVLLTIDQPWSEYLRKDAQGISPIHFADALIRADLGLSGLALELNFDAWPGGTFPRDPIELNLLIDRWSMLGLPLMVIVSSPTTAKTSCSASRIADWQMPTPELTCDEDLTQSDQGSGMIDPETLVKLLLSKPSIHAVIWNSCSDTTASLANDSGLWDQQGNAKPVLNCFADIRERNLH